MTFYLWLSMCSGLVSWFIYWSSEKILEQFVKNKIFKLPNLLRLPAMDCGNRIFPPTKFKYMYEAIAKLQLQSHLLLKYLKCVGIASKISFAFLWLLIRVILFSESILPAAQLCLPEVGDMKWYFHQPIVFISHQDFIDCWYWVGWRHSTAAYNYFYFWQ